MAIAHGNGPQVGFILRRSEIARHELHEVPLDVCGADSQGAIGYALQQNLYNDFLRHGHRPAGGDHRDPDRGQRRRPRVPESQQAHRLLYERERGQPADCRRRLGLLEDAGRGWRRMVASPKPMRIVEEPVVRTLLDNGVVVITVGGGGIPVVGDAEGKLTGAAAVIDKDLASSLLASNLDADLFIISTAVEKVALNFGKPDEVWLDTSRWPKPSSTWPRVPTSPRAAWPPRSRPSSTIWRRAANTPSSPTRPISPGPWPGRRARTSCPD